MRPSLLPTLLLTLLPTFALAEQALLRICYETEDSMPFWTDAEQANPGLVVELIKSAAQQADLRLELQRQPWKRCILQLQSGQSDGIFAAIWQADRDAWGQFPGRDPERQQAVDRDYRLWQVDYPIITRIDSSLQWNGQQFSGLQFGLSAPLGYVASQRLQALGVQAKDTINLNAEKALKLVALGRLDGYVLEHQIGNTHIRKLDLQNDLTMLPVPFLEADWYLPLSHQFTRQHPQQAQRFWQALRDQRMRQEVDLSQRYLHIGD
ncbi:substrate-binding periplasmic protein [Pseudomonas leptonychotis]|uniref:substrate-binding periplasmic protein n=1 Tax=Pseudomonas leptonychotis TaxID=2448482 RepID=UPI00386C70D6